MPRCRPVERGEGETGDMGVAETVGAAGAGAVNMAAGSGLSTVGAERRAQSGGLRAVGSERRAQSGGLGTVGSERRTWDGGLQSTRVNGRAHQQSEAVNGRRIYRARGRRWVWPSSVWVRSRRRMQHAGRASRLEG
ncbi:uncharacterized protein M421DRAFT_192817 [Didymella exigua CBS 183.55]|uniref:Uncharacterized protein n=1 Tax=Didymella exigua CBS 183.55 TaxID=1150837 RepID=A0A6A5S0E2_9PLEO|nr:uncharacterized protein M421DRAFT_192817 [Didymella exigua CBS 183.55]KAF1933269.1 hypothetical protein M421DRAFT_192817 [Didymella exigua CBS 183.55]